LSYGTALHETWYTINYIVLLPRVNLIHFAPNSF
jgi:hypothetical protein